MEAPNRADGFGPYFKRYTKTWQHAVATAALTAFGMLTFVDKLFAIVAISAYVLPPLVLYARRSPAERAPSSDAEEAPTADETPTTDETPTAADESPTTEADGTPDDERTPSPTPDDEESTAAEAPTPDWEAATVPTDAALLDAAVTGDGAYAVGAGGVVVGDDGEGWTELLADGPRAGSNALRGVAAVEEGGVWVAGENGALGRLDPATGRHVDYSAPDGDSSNLVDVAAAGSGGAESAGDETLLVVNGSGEVRRGRYRNGDLKWADPTTPGSGSSLAGVALADESAGYACDTSQSVFETTDGGRSFEEVGVDADGTLTDVATTGPGACAVSADDGVIHRYDGDRWTPERLADEPILAVALGGERGLACGEGGAYEREGAGGWERETTPAMGALRSVALGVSRAVAVGEDGTVVERGIGSGT
ncbi:WD40/YVTN/BNR-like repeat-containing protein [Halorussus salinus]|uniref:WD40/YVTN/BNR-like repeat-containing protein n=1 Tax=Halorussus salinus TaxID=1364935 RepID=UPI001092DBE8|nr:hypothetical protein [Halorussus salinus]